MSLSSRLAAAAAAVLGASPGVAHAIEQPEYTVVSEHAGWELRSYEPAIEARVMVTGPWEDAGRDGFRILGGYIFGGNQPQESIAMTAPVAAQRSNASGESIAMTAPVAAQRSPGTAELEQWTIAFTMPSEWRLETLPIPDDPRIELVQVPSRQVAALSFGLWATESRVAEKTAELLGGLDAAGFTPLAEPVVAQYNPPWTPPPFRNNEILVAVGPLELSQTSH